MKIMLITSITSSKVNSIYITSPLGKVKRNIIFPIKGSNRHRVMVLSGYPKISCLLYHIICYKSILNQKGAPLSRGGSNIHPLR